MKKKFGLGGLVRVCTQCHGAGLKLIVLMLQHWTHSRNRPNTTAPIKDEKKKSLLYFGCDFCAWYSFGKIIKIVATRCHILKLQEVQLSPSNRAMRLVISNLANYHATVQKLLIRQVLTKPMV